MFKCNTDKMNINKSLRLIGLVTALFLSSCLDFDIKKAQQFGSISEEFEDKYELIVKDIYESCKREMRYRGKVRFGDPKKLRSRLQEKCLGIAYHQEALLMSHALLAKYTGAFRKLSSDEIIEELDGAGNLAEAILDLPIPQLSAISPVTKVLPIAELANSIQRAIAEQKRRKVLKSTILEVNTNIQLYISEISKFTEDLYVNQLRDEEIGMEKYFSTIIAQELDKSEIDRVTQPVQVSVLLADKLWQEESEKANFPYKYSELDKYLKSLKKMARLHQELYADSANFN